MSHNPSSYDKRFGGVIHAVASIFPRSFSYECYELVYVTVKCYYFNLRLGAPDFVSQTPNCAEETLTREYLQTGYRDTVEGLEVCH